MLIRGNRRAGVSGGLVAAALTTLMACGAPGKALPRVAASNSITLASPAFASGSAIPATYTCDGENVSPPFTWTGGPPAEEYVLVVTDRDAHDFVQWVVFGIPGGASGLSEGAIPDGAREGANGFGKMGYGGPCPPPGDSAHEYVFTLYSLRTQRSGALRSGASLDQVLDAIQCCVLGQGTLTGTYRR